MVARLRTAAIVEFKSKDIFRASQLSLLGVSNSHVEKDRKKIANGVALSPLLLVRDESNGKVIIADGSTGFARSMDLMRMRSSVARSFDMRLASVGAFHAPFQLITFPHRHHNDFLHFKTSSWATWGRLNTYRTYHDSST
jgi:hypothetical protein